MCAKRRAYHIKAFMEIQPHIIKVSIMPHWVCSGLQLLRLPPRQGTATQSAKQGHSEEVRALGSLVLEAPYAFHLYLKTLRRLTLLNLKIRQVFEICRNWVKPRN